MAVWAVLIMVAFAGLIGGVVNALLVHEGLIMIKTETLKDGTRIWRPGFLGNVFFGAVAALLVAILYSPLLGVPLGDSGAGQAYNPTLGTLAGAFFAGAGGARILTNEIDKRQLQSAGQDVADALLKLLK